LWRKKSIRKHHTTTPNPQPPVKSNQTEMERLFVERPDPERLRSLTKTDLRGNRLAKARSLEIARMTNDDASDEIDEILFHVPENPQEKPRARGRR